MRAIIPVLLRKPCRPIRAVEPQRVERRDLVQESLLRRDADRDPPVREQDRLPQLPVPVPEGERLPLEGRHLEVGAERVVPDRLRDRPTACA